MLNQYFFSSACFAMWRLTWVAIRRRKTAWVRRTRPTSSASCSSCPSRSGRRLEAADEQMDCASSPQHCGPDAEDVTP